MKLNGKLLRIQEQEKLLLDSYNSKLANQNEHHVPKQNLIAESTVGQETENDSSLRKSKKSKKKKRKRQDMEASDVMEEQMTSGVKDDTDRLEEHDHQSCDEPNVSESVHKCKKRKKSKKDKLKTDCDVDNIESVDIGRSGSLINVAVDEDTYNDVSKKISKKKKKHKVHK